MEDKNFTIIEDIFDTDDSNDTQMNSNNYKKDFSFLRTLDSQSVRQPYPTSNIPSLSYDEDMIKNKLSRQINPRSLASQYNSMNNTNRIMQTSPQQLNDTLNNTSNNMNKNIQLKPMTQVQDPVSISHLSCRNVYEHIENCPFCQKYYKQSNRTYILIIVFLVLIILLLLRQNSN
jgi:hypothetical protein